MINLQSFIDGDWRDGSGTFVEDRNPARPSEVVAHGPLAGPAELEAAVAAAQGARRSWAATPMHDRGAVLLRAATLIDAAAPQWGRELTREEGKTLAEGVGEVRRAAQILRYYAGAADRSAGSVYSSPRLRERIFVTRKPLGVVGVITPFNFPIAIPAWKIAPALVYGNTVVWKPAGAVPLLAMRLTQALAQAGLPQGVVNLVVADNTVGALLADHPGIDGITFTGSTPVGRRIAAAGAARGVAVQAEMGGKNAAVVLADANLDLAVEQVMLGAFRSTGQKCTATSRLVLDHTIADEFLAELALRVKSLAVGDPLDPSVDIGPVVSASSQRSLKRAIAAATATGARLVAAAEAPQGDGFFVAPTVLEVPSSGAGIWNEELFGPVVAVQRAHSVEHAFALANEGEYGLSAAVFTDNLSAALRATEALEVGILHVNSESAGADPHVPFGGAKKSGYGPSEQGDAAREFFTHVATAYIREGRAG